MIDKNKKAIIFYHKEDNDGVFSGAIIYNYLTTSLGINKDCVTVCGVGYDDMKRYTIGDIYSLKEQYDYIIMTDISFNDYRLMRHTYKVFGNDFIWIDHHAPVIKASFGKNGWSECPGIRSTSDSAIINAYYFFYDPLISRNAPELLRVLSAWDSFTYKQNGYELGYVNRVNIGINEIYKLDINKVIGVIDAIITYDNFGKNIISDAYEKGDIIVSRKEYENKKLVDDWGDFSWTIGDDNRPACMLVNQSISSSLMFASCADRAKNGIVFKHNPSGSWTISLYNTSTEYDSEFDCGDYLSKKYNGGGHKGAAGCQVSEDKFIEILRSKHV